jgi:hypothetical protein
MTKTTNLSLRNVNPNLKTADTQMAMILESLLLGEKLTVLDGLVRFKCLSLSQRISDLERKHGWTIHREMILTDSGKRVAQYSLYKDFKETS